MQMLDVESSKIFGTYGSGNQEKIWLNNHGDLIKINSKFREASKEVDAYKLAKLFGLNCAKYERVNVKVHGKERCAVITKSFLNDTDTEITVYEILEKLNITVPMNMSAVDFINITVKAISDVTNINIKSVYKWVYDMLVFDYIICNDDRHFTNFEVIYNQASGKFRLAPYFDHGHSFFRTDAYLDKKRYTEFEYKYKSKPFSSNSDKNVGDRKLAKISLDNMLRHCGGISGIKNLDIGQGHKRIALLRIERLQSMLCK